MNDPWLDPRVKAGLARQFARRATQLEAGEERLGWKVGFGSPSALELMGLGGPLIGFLTTGTLLPTDSALEVADWVSCVVEFEVAVYLGHDLPHGRDEGAVRSAVAAVGPAIEIADLNLEVGPDRVSDIVAGNIFHRAVVLGEAQERGAGLNIEGIEALVRVGGAELARTGSLEELTGRYLDVVATVASTLELQGERLRAGDVIITGSLFPPRPVDTTAAFEFTLAPFESIGIEIRA